MAIDSSKNDNKKFLMIQGRLLFVNITLPFEGIDLNSECLCVRNSNETNDPYSVIILCPIVYNYYLLFYILLGF